MFKKLSSLFCYVAISLAFASDGFAQIQVSPSTDATQMANDFLGGAINISNVSYTGGPNQSGFFTGGLSSNTGLGFNSGILLTTGDINLAVGPNSAENTGAIAGTPGDNDLGPLTFDAAVLEFDFELTQPKELTFEFVFGSDEYLEFVNSTFNDNFACFVNGANIAVVPNTNAPISIDTVNSVVNSQFYLDNPATQGVFDIEYDGLTVTMLATTGLLPAGTHHLKIAIADEGDGDFDSGVFLRSGSFECLADCTFETDQILCDLGDAGNLSGDFVLTGLFTNLQDIPGTHLLLPQNAISPAGAELCFGNGQNVRPLDMPLNNGAGYDIGNDLTNDNAIVIKNADPGDEVCFLLTLLGEGGVECCTIEICVVMPPCDCLQIDTRYDEITDVECDSGSGTVDFTYTFQLTNLFGQDVYHTFIAPLGSETYTPNYLSLIHISEPTRPY